MKITYLKGDAVRDPVRGVICHCCNDIGAWGAGFVLALSAVYPGAERAYRMLGTYELGHCQIVPVRTGLCVANIIGQHGVGGVAVRYDALAAGLETAALLGLPLHMPRLGCGLAGGKWSLVEPILQVLPVPVTVYDL